MVCLRLYIHTHYMRSKRLSFLFLMLTTSALRASHITSWSLLLRWVVTLPCEVVEQLQYSLPVHPRYYLLKPELVEAGQVYWKNRWRHCLSVAWSPANQSLSQTPESFKVFAEAVASCARSSA